MLPIAVSFSAGVRVEVIEPEPAVADVEFEADELSLEAAAVVVVVVVDDGDDDVVVDDVLSPLLSLAVCEAVSQCCKEEGRCEECNQALKHFMPPIL